MASYREEEDPFEEDIVFDQAGLLTNTTKMNTAIRRVSSGKCALFAKTLGLCGAFFGLGLCIAIPGPTFLRPITELQADISPISSIYTARSSGYLIGSIIGGILFDHFNRLFLLFISLLLTAVFITVTPWCRVLWLLEACMVLLGMTMGFLDTGGNVLCLDLWGRNSGPFMQALHFSFGLGAFVAPLLAAPFLEPAGMDISPTFVSSTAMPFQVQDLHTLGVDRDKRSIPQLESMESLLMITKVESTNGSLVENLSTPINAYTESAVNTTSGPLSVTAIDGLDTNRTTQTITTTQRVPKPKPKKTNASSLGNKDWDNVHVRTVPQEDLRQQQPSTTSATNTPSSLGTTHLDMATLSQQQPTTTTATTSTPTTPTTATTITITTTSASDNNPTKEYIHTIPNSMTSASPVLKTTLSAGKSEGNNNEVPGKEIPNVVATSATMISTIATSRNDAGSNPDRPIDRTYSKSEMNPSLLLRATESSDISPHSSSVPVLNTFVETTTENSVSKLKLDMNRTAKSSVESVVRNEYAWTHVKTTAPYETQSYTNPRVLTEFSSPVAVEEVDRSDMKSDTGPSKGHSIQPVIEQLTSTNVNLVPIPTDPTWIASRDRSSVSVNSLPGGHTHHSKPHTFDNDTEVNISIFDIMANRIEKYGFSKVQFTYFMVGLFVFAISLVFLGFLCHNPRDPKSKQEEGQGAKKISNRALHSLLISLMALFFLLYVGLEVTYGQLVLAFAMHGDLQLAQSTGLVIAVVFWGSFAAMRFASIFFSSGFGPITMLLLNFVFCTLGTVLLSTMASHTETALWVGTALLGIGLASVFPTGILWIERYIHISNKVAAAFVMSASLGEIVCPVAVYRLMINNPAMLMHSAVLINVLCILTFIAIRGLALRHGEKYCAASNNGYQLANQDEEEDMIDMSPSGSMVTSRRHSFSSEHRALLNGNLHRGP